jgi:hypothetical protein
MKLRAGKDIKEDENQGPYFNLGSRILSRMRSKRG